MNARKVLPLVVIAGGLAVARKLGSARGPPMNWGRIIERMPDDAPPKWMFNNITALREQQGQILDQNQQILAELNRLGGEHAKLLGARGDG